MQIVNVKISELKPYENNAKKHDKEQIENVATSIKNNKFVQPIVIDKNNVIVIGHCRYEAAKKLKLKEVPCVIVDYLDEEQVNALRIIDNKTNESEWDMDLLIPELDNLYLDDYTFDWDFSDEENDDELSDELLKLQFEERMANGENLADNEEYQEFLQKFEAKKTTDDCYTPTNIYEAVKNWAVEKYNLQGRKIIRPFYPNGNYQKERYPKNCVVIDNPPFSILAEIKRWYEENKIDYFLFAPQLTMFSGGKGKFVIVNIGIVYENGANVSTSFVTNMGNAKITISSDLYEILKKENKKNLKKLHREIPTYSYPDNVTTSSRLGFMASHGCNFEIDEKDLYFIRALDSQKEQGKSLFGSGFLLSEQKAQEQKAQEQKAQEQKAQEQKAQEQKAQEQWELSERELRIIEKLG